MSSSIHGAIAERYATALFELAEEQGTLDPVAADLKKVDALILESEDFRRLLKSPILSRTEQQKAVLAVAEKAGLSPLTAHFLGLLARNRRLFVTSEVIRAYLSRLAGRRGEVTAEVVSAIPLSKEQAEAVTASLTKYVGGRVSLDARVDPGILGGLVVKVGSRMVDNSLKTKLQHLKLAMKGIG